MVRNRLFILSVIILLAGATRAFSEGIDLAAMQGWDIVVAANTIPSERYAADELKSHFAEATGVSLPIVTAAEKPGGHIFIGVSPMMRKGPGGFDTADFGPEDLRIVIRDDSIVIAGGRPRGSTRSIRL